MKMSKLTLDEAIKYCLEVAEQKEHDSITTTGDYELDIAMKEGCIQCAADYRQLAEWLKELKEAKRLLEAVMDDMNSNNFCCKFDSCKVCSKKYNVSCDKKFQWHYTDKALKLLGDESNV